MDGFYTKEPLTTTTPRSSVPPEERFRNRRLIDESTPEAMDQPNPHFHNQWGYQPSDQLDDVGPSVRMTAQLITDPGQYVASIIEGMARVEQSGQQPLRWQADILNAGKTESAIITRADVQEWLDRLELDPAGKRTVLSNASSPEGLQKLADGLVLAGIADTGRIMGHHVILFRGRR